MAQHAGQLGAPQQLADGLHVGGGRVTLRCKRAAACLLLMTRSSFAEIESNLLQHTPDRPPLDRSDRLPGAHET